MGLESIPFLTAIIASIGSVLKAIWDFAKQRAVLLVLFFGKLVRWVWNLLSNWLTYKYVLLAGLILLFGTTISVFVQNLTALSPYFRSIREGWQALLDTIPGFAWIVWNDDGFLRLSKGFRGFVPIFIAWASGSLACLGIRSLRVMAMIALNAKLGKGS